MTKTIICMAEEEPSAFHPEDKRGFSVRLAFETDEPDIALAQQAYLAFISALQGDGGAVLKFHAFTVDASNILTPIADPDHLGESPVLLDDFKSWLEGYAQTQANALSAPGTVKQSFWTARPLGQDKFETSATTDACRVLIGASSWEAPVPHKLGLAHVLRIDRATLGEVVFLPCFHDQDLPAGAAGVDAGEVHFSYNNVSGLADTCRSTRTHDVDKQGTLLDLETGFLTVSQQDNDQALHRALTRFEQRAGSLFTGFFATGEVKWLPPVRTVNDDGAFAIQQARWIKLQNLRRLSWRAVSTLAASMDTLLLALMMPNQYTDPTGRLIGAEKNARDGALLGPFLNLLIECLNKARLVTKITRSELRRTVRKGISGLGLSRPEAPDRETYIKNLLFICRPEVAAGETPFAGTDSWLYRLLQGYINQTQERWDALTEKTPEQPLEELTTQLAPLHEYILSEKGFEASLVRLLRLATDSVFNQLCEIIDPADRGPQVKQAYIQALQEFEQLLNDGLNGAEAARQSVGALICDTVTRAAVSSVAPLPITAKNLEEMTRKLEFWKWRLGHDPSVPNPAPELPSQLLLSCLSLPIPEPGKFFNALPNLPVDTDALEALSTASSNMQQDVLRDLFTPDTLRFTPDSAPASLAIPVTVDPVIDDEESADDFTAAFSGMALVMRRAFDAEKITDEPWAYANLNEFSYPEDPRHLDTSLLEVLSIQALPTTINDGRRALFVRYDGLPFATSAFDNSLPGGGFDPLGTAFFGTDYPEKPPVSYQRLPALAYGAMFEVCAHVVGRCGSLPKSLQSDGQRPWRVQPAINFVDPPQTLLLPYSRRTAIGRTTITDGLATPRIGVIPQGLQPLSADYPRLAMQSDDGLFLDLFRRTDGSGALDFDATTDSSMALHLDDFRYSGPAGSTSTLSVAVCDGYPTTDYTVAIDLDDATSSHKTLLIKYAANEFHVEFEGSNATFSHQPGRDSLWLRLRLTSTGGVASISFADPTAGTGRAPGQAARGEHLLLLGAPSRNADKTPSMWRAPFADPVKLNINFPRVGYADFARWVANPALRKELFSGVENEDIQREFLFLLEAANIDRSRDLELGKLLDSLIDPAVHSLRLDVIALDGLSSSIEGLRQRSDLKPQSAAMVPIKSLGMMLNEIKHCQKMLEDGLIKKVLNLLNDQWRHSITIEPLASDSSEALAFDKKDTPQSLNVPAGVNVQLSARPRVFHTRFKGKPSVLDHRLEQLAVGTDGVFSVFDGATLIMESMIGPLLWMDKDHVSALQWLKTRDEWAAIARDVIQYRPVGTARVYDLLAKDFSANHWQWRQLGAVTVTTQRWRFIGRPIYSWINPKGRDEKEVGCASRKIDNNTQLLAEFEEEAFYDRDDSDAKSITVNLLPGPAPTTLYQVQWEKPSASFFRHRFTLHSRYAAVMTQSSNGRCEAWSLDPREAHESWLRVAMLADPSRIVLTRPQVRAIIPLTQSPEAGAGNTPPLLAILQEHPFEYGGLADRVVAEIRTGIGFAAIPATDTEDARVAPFDTRKELGPDPRLSYQAFPVASGHSALLSVEGPIGLTFENDAIHAPAFPNNAQILNPVSLEVDRDGTLTARSLSVEEHFLSVVLRRYLHPDWVVAPVRSLQTQTVDLSRGYWIELPTTRGELKLANNPTPLSVIRLEDDHSALHVSVDWRVVDPTVSNENRITLGHIPGFFTAGEAKHGWSIVLLNTPVDDRRASLSVFMVPPGKAVERRGGGNTPMLLASIEWALPRDCQSSVLTVDSPNALIRDISASQTTAMHWVRTNKNFAAIAIAGSNVFEAGTAQNVENLVAVAGHDRLSFSTGDEPLQAVWIRPDQSMRAYPTHTQRHLAVLFSETRSGLGRALERPTGLQMVQSKSQALNSTFAYEPGAGSVRVIEFETPASIIGYAPSGSNVIPVHHKFGYFDFAAIGFDFPPKGDSLLTISLHFRLVASGSTRARLSEISFVLNPEPSQNAPGYPLKFTRTSGVELATFGMDLSIAKSGEVVELSQWEVDAQGQARNVPAVLSAITMSGNAQQGMVLTVGSATFSDNQDHEFWLEVSMLVSTKSDIAHKSQGFTSALDIDWFFGADQVSPDSAANEDSLRSLHEAQARIISVSPPIKVSEKK